MYFNNLVKTKRYSSISIVIVIEVVDSNSRNNLGTYVANTNTSSTNINIILKLFKVES